MSSGSKLEDRCSWTGRTLVFVLATGAVVCSFLSGYSCEFFSFESTTGIPWIALVPPFDSTIAADLGLFGYRIRESTVPEEITGGCVSFDNFFMDLEHAGTLWMVAQFCAVFAVIFGLLGCLFLFCDCVCASASCPFLLPASCFFAAMGLQGCTGLILFENDFCFHNDSMHECRLEAGGWYSVASICGYWISSSIICCLPRSDLCFLQKGTSGGGNSPTTTTRANEDDNREDTEKPLPATSITPPEPQSTKDDVNHQQHQEEKEEETKEPEEYAAVKDKKEEKEEETKEPE